MLITHFLIHYDQKLPQYFCMKINTPYAQNANKEKIKSIWNVVD